MTLSKRRRAELERVAWRLTDRDWAILRDLGRVRLLTGRLIQRLHVYDESPQTQARRTRSVLQRLYDLGLVVRLERRVGGVRAGSAGYTYGLSTAGQRLITGAGPAGGHRLRRPWEPSAAFVDHILAVSELYVELREAERSGTTELLAFDTEPTCWRSWSGPNGESYVLRPDAHIVTATGEQELFVFLELDRATESLRIIRRKAEMYVEYWQSGLEQQRHEVFPKVLFVVPDERRRAGVVQTLARLNATSWQLFQAVARDKALGALTDRPPPRRGQYDAAM